MHKYRNLNKWLPVMLWMAVIFLLSHQNAEASSKVSGGILTAVLTLLEEIFRSLHLSASFVHLLIRKGAHFTAYLILGVLISRASEEKDSKVYLRVLLISMLYAISDEFHQVFIPGRSGNLPDVILDSMGATAGIMLYRIFILRSGFTKKDQAADKPA